MDSENEYFLKKSNVFRKKDAERFGGFKKSSTFALAYQKW